MNQADIFVCTSKHPLSRPGINGWLELYVRRDTASTPHMGSSVVTHSVSIDDEARVQRFSAPSSQENIHTLGHMVPEVPP